MRRSNTVTLSLLSAVSLAFAMPAASGAETAKNAKSATAIAKPKPVKLSGPVSIAKQGYFFVNGQYATSKDGQIMVGQMFVQFQIPQARTHKYPVIMWHGGGQTGTNFLGTPDGRPGWADYFLRQGYAVYVVDQPGRARSGYFTDTYGPTRRPNATAMSERFTAPELANLYPQSKFHTQWPGKGVAGDPVFDQFFASQVEDMSNLTMLEDLNRNAGAALLDKIGPSIILGHSQAGAFLWPVADARPQAIKAILAIEPNGPPVRAVDFVGEPDWFKYGGVALAYGVSDVPLTYDPPVKDPGELKFVQQEKADADGLVRCFEQVAPARKLPNLSKIPTLVMMSEASYHAPYDHCTVKYLRTAGVNASFIRLADLGIKGDSHVLMLESNSHAIAAEIAKWLTANVKAK